MPVVVCVGTMKDSSGQRQFSPICRTVPLLSSWGFVVSRMPTIKASRENAHGPAFDVRSLSSNSFGDGLDKECAALTWLRRGIYERESWWIVFPLFQVWVVDLLNPLTVSPGTLIKMKREHKELLSSLRNQRWLKPPNWTMHSEWVFCLLFRVDWALLPLSTCKLVYVLVAGNCLPYHQPEFLATKGSKKAEWLSRLLVALYLPLLHRVKGWPHGGRWIPDTPNLTSSGLAVVRCFPVQVHRAIPTPLSQAKGANWT